MTAIGLFSHVITIFYVIVGLMRHLVDSSERVSVAHMCTRLKYYKEIGAIHINKQDFLFIIMLVMWKKYLFNVYTGEPVLYILLTYHIKKFIYVITHYHKKSCASSHIHNHRNQLPWASQCPSRNGGGGAYPIVAGVPHPSTSVTNVPPISAMSLSPLLTDVRPKMALLFYTPLTNASPKTETSLPPPPTPSAPMLS
jgi:hypothetical protein